MDFSKEQDKTENLQKLISEIKSGDELNFYIKNAYNNIPFFMKALTQHNSNTYTYFGDIQKNLFYISDNMRDDFGFKSNLVIGLLEKWRNCIYGKKWKKAYDDDQKRLIETKSEIHDLYYQVKDRYGKIFWIRCCGNMEWDKDHKKPLFFAGRVSKQSDFFIVDPVTNFPTCDTLQRILKDRGINGDQFWTIGFYLNKMSKINTLHGHNFADRLIQDISRDLTDSLGDIMTFYRLPGVRCMAVADADIDKDEVINKIRTIIDEEYKKFGLVVDIPCSFVAMKFPQGEWTAEEFQENMVALIKLAQHEKEKDCVVNIDENIAKIRAISNMSMIITQNVLNYMENFRIVVQPVVSAKTGKIIAGETLMRWSCKDKDISPEIFIPILEKDRMIQIAGRWVFEEAVKVCSNIVKVNPDFYLTVNVSLLQLYDNELIPFIPAVLEKYNLSGNHIVIEMTESCMDNEPGKLMELICKSKKLGIRLALDDFGTGYSSLRVLMKYPIDIIKIDRSLLLEMAESEAKNNFFTSLIHAGHHFGKKICVEGVETERQKNLVQKSNGDMIQGFYYYRPMEIPDLYNEILRLKDEN